MKFRKGTALLLAGLMTVSAVGCGGGSSDDGKAPAASKPAAGTPAVSTPAAPAVNEYSWWENDWYGWWTVFDGDGTYANQINESWDCCMRIEPDGDGHKITIWDEDYNEYGGKNLAEVKVSIDPKANQAVSVADEGNYFWNGGVGDGDWVIDPDYAGVDDMLIIEGAFQDEDGEYCEYGLVLTKWGYAWNENASTYPPECYYDYFYPLLEDGEEIPERFVP